MKKKVKNNLINAGIILVILVVIYFSLVPKGNTPTTSEEIAQCIGEKSTLYVQLGCSHCETQKELFGENFQYLNTIDCFYEPERCADVSATPTWEIKNDYYTGVQQIETLRELTGC